MKLIAKENAGIHPPEGGWKENTTYVCEVSFSAHNPAHVCIFHSGYLDILKRPAGYNAAFNPSWDGEIKYVHQLYYLKPIRELYVNFQDYLDWEN